MSDDADLASRIEEETLANILANRPKTLQGVSATECEECGDRIPQSRREALQGVKHCIDCAIYLANKNKFKTGAYR